MAPKHSALSFSLCLLVLFHACSAVRQPCQSSQQNMCMLSQIQAREPDNRIETEAGRIESWDYNQDDFQCAGVAVQRFTIERNGLHLPSYTNTPRLVYVVEGRGHLGLVFPGCPETFEESEQSFEEQQEQKSQGHRPRLSSREGQRFGEQGQQQEEFEQLDRHQRVRVIKQGDVIAVPAGVTTWVHNHGDQSLVYVTLLDISNNKNQLDQNPRRFYLAGNPQDEFNFDLQRQSKWRPRSQQGKRFSHQQQQQNTNNNIFSGFEARLLADALNIDMQTVQQLQAQNDNRPQIIRVEGRFEFVETPETRREERQLQPSMGGENGFEELFCHMKIKQNIGHPSTADVFNPQAGRISTLNSFSLPILRFLRLSAERGLLYTNAIHSPRWNLNAHEIIYVIRGSARVQVVNDNGETILDDQVRQGQLFIVPQNHAVLQKALNNGYEYIAFKTSDNAMVNTLAGRTSVLRALPDMVLANAYQIDRQQARNLKYNRQETLALSSSRSVQSLRQ